jgi:uncharacterized protein
MTLHEAAMSNVLRHVRELLQRGADPNSIDELTGEIALTIAAERGADHIARALLDAGADPNLPKALLPPLIAAAAGGFGGMLSLLLSRGAKIDARDETGGTALMSAAAGGHLEVVRLLVAGNANTALSDQKGQTAILVAAVNQHRDVVEFLAPYVSSEDQGRARVLMDPKQPVPSDVAQRLVDVAKRGNAAEVFAILGSGVPANAINSDGTTALMWAANFGHLQLVQQLIAAGADPQIEDMYGETALSHAASHETPLVFQFLYPMASAKDRRRCMRIVARNQLWTHQYPAWQGWKPPMPTSEPRRTKPVRRHHG